MSYLPVMHDKCLLIQGILWPLVCVLFYRGRVKYIDLILCLYYKCVKFSFWFSIYLVLNEMLTL